MNNKGVDRLGGSTGRSVPFLACNMMKCVNGSHGKANSVKLKTAPEKQEQSDLG